MLQEATILPAFHFLVVDDQMTVRRVIAAMLEKLGCAEASEAEDGATALSLLQAGEAAGTPINFVVTDWNMPNMNGLALLETIRATDSLQHLPVLMITTESERSHIVAATRAGVDGYLIKSELNIGTLKAAIDHIMIKRRQVERGRRNAHAVL